MKFDKNSIKKHSVYAVFQEQVKFRAVKLPVLVMNGTYLKHHYDIFYDNRYKCDYHNGNALSDS